MKASKLYGILFWASAVLMLAVIMPIMPTFDAWTTTSAPNPAPMEWHELLPQGEYWRPWDVMYSHFVGTFPDLFPWLNHLFIGIVHVLNCWLTYLIARRLDCTERVSAIALGYVYLCPAMLGVVVDVDSIHQVAALAWGLLSLYVYLGSAKHCQRVAAWLLFVLIGTLAKESCFAFMLITPFVAWGCGKTKGAEFWRDIAWAVLVGMAYLVARLSLSQGEIASEYIGFEVAQLLKNHAIFILFHLPVILILLFNIGRLRDKTVLVMLCCIMFASVLHLVSVYATMHPYVSLPFAAVIFALAANCMRWRRAVCAAGVVGSLVIDVWLTKETYDSGELGRRLAWQAIESTPEKPDSVYTISVAAGKKGFSTFIVRDYNAFAWGIFSRYLNRFEWPTVLKDTTLTDYPTQQQIDEITKAGHDEGFHTFWLVRNDSIEVIRK